ncbi:hypothetical protein SKA34_20292, partial [Photobacterium sp. SKA34]
ILAFWVDIWRLFHGIYYTKVMPLTLGGYSFIID